MISIEQAGTLMCNRVGHNSNPIQTVCMKKGCDQPIPCCIQCITQEHKNHQNNDFFEIPFVREQINFRWNYLNKLSELSESICQFCESWRKQIQKLIDQIKESQLLPQNPTLAQLTNCVQSIRESVNKVKQEEIINAFTNQFNNIKSQLEQLKRQTNCLLENQQGELIQQSQEIKLLDAQQQIKISEQSHVQKKNNLNFSDIKFKLTKLLEGHSNAVFYVAISNDDKYLASSDIAYIVILWDVESNNQMAQFRIKYQYITSLQFSNAHSMLAVGSSSAYYKMKKFQINKCRTVVNQIQPSFDLKFSKRVKSFEIFSLGQFRKIKLFYGNPGIIEIFDLTNLKNTQAKIQLEGHSRTIYRITFSDDSKHLISVSNDKSLRVWNLFENKEINRQNCENYICGVSYSSKQNLIACCDHSGFAYLFDSRALNNLVIKGKWNAHNEHSYCIEFIKNSTVIMTSSTSETRFWQVDDILQQKFNHFKEIKDGGWVVKAHPLDDPQVIINCDENEKFVNLWNYNSNELIQSIEIPGGLNQSFAITSDFKKIITGGSNQKVNIFEQN